jgi:hypothetical protein
MLGRLRWIVRRLRQIVQRLRQPALTTTVLDAYVSGPPSPRHAVEIFRGEWASRFPAPLDDVPAGRIALFEDPRLAWAIAAVGGLRGQRVLELGPLEGGHSYMCDRAGAAEVVAIEANTRAYLKCLIAKELLGMPSVRFVCGDFVEYLGETTARFDFCVASGVLYHMKDPVELIARLSRIVPRLFLWTHYYDEAIIGASPRLAHRRVTPTTATVEGFTHQLHRQEYRELLASQRFRGGTSAHCQWMSRAGILGALGHFGYRTIEIGLDEPDHANGPAFSLVALR